MEILTFPWSGKAETIAKLSYPLKPKLPKAFPNLSISEVIIPNNFP
jgi:hypothetical protein